MTHHMTKFEPDGSKTTWESKDGRSWLMTGQTYPEKKALPEPAVKPRSAFGRWVDRYIYAEGKCFDDAPRGY